MKNKHPIVHIFNDIQHYLFELHFDMKYTDEHRLMIIITSSSKKTEKLQQNTSVQLFIKLFIVSYFHSVYFFKRIQVTPHHPLQHTRRIAFNLAWQADLLAMIFVLIYFHVFGKENVLWGHQVLGY